MSAVSCEHFRRIFCPFLAHFSATFLGPPRSAHTHCQPPPMARKLLGSLLYTTRVRLCSACAECLSAGSCNPGPCNADGAWMQACSTGGCRRARSSASRRATDSRLNCAPARENVRKCSSPTAWTGGQIRTSCRCPPDCVLRCVVRVRPAREHPDARVLRAAVGMLQA